MAVQEDMWGREVEVINGMLSDLESGVMLAVHKDISEVVGGRGDEVGMFELHSGSDLGTTFVHKDASNGAEGKVGMIEGIDAGSGSDSGTAFMHEDASKVVGNMENEVGRVIKGMVSGSGLGLSFIAEGAGMC
jgi:hypothetical protein